MQAHPLKGDWVTDFAMLHFLLEVIVDLKVLLWRFFHQHMSRAAKHFDQAYEQSCEMQR